MDGVGEEKQNHGPDCCGSGIDDTSNWNVEISRISCSPVDFTTVVAVDEQHVKELEIVYPTWQRFRPEINDQPFMVIADTETISAKEWIDRLKFLRRKIILVPWFQYEAGFESQREKMLTALTVLPGRMVETPWFLKLDTDVVATGTGGVGGYWLNQNWMYPGELNPSGQPAFISSPWGYTKPADAIYRLEKWANAKGETSLPLNIPFDPAASSVRCARIISYVYFGNTEWHSGISDMIGNERLPVPSQDTLCWYLAERRSDHYLRVKMKHLGWAHVNGVRRLRETVAQVMEGAAA